MTDIVDYVNGLKSLSGLRILTAEQSDFLFDAADEIERLRAVSQPATALRDYLVQIQNVSRDNAPESCNHRIALDYVHQLTAVALSSAERGQP